jgi:uncharacterized membrane protein
MTLPRFPQPFQHDHPPVANVNDLLTGHSTPGQRLADRVVAILGSWAFISIQSVILAGWVVLNIVAWAQHWDPYPFILMNLFLSLQAAYTAPVLLMSQNRAAARDRLEAHNDYLTDVKSEVEVRAILDHLAAQDQALISMHTLLERVTAQLDMRKDAQ